MKGDVNPVCLKNIYYFQTSLYRNRQKRCKKTRNRATSKINLDIVLPCPNIQDNKRYNIYMQLSIQYQDCGVKNVNNLVLS